VTCQGRCQGPRRCPTGALTEGNGCLHRRSASALPPANAIDLQQQPPRLRPHSYRRMNPDIAPDRAAEAAAAPPAAQHMSGGRISARSSGVGRRECRCWAALESPVVRPRSPFPEALDFFDGSRNTDKTSWSCCMERASGRAHGAAAASNPPQLEPTVWPVGGGRRAAGRSQPAQLAVRKGSDGPSVTPNSTKHAQTLTQFAEITQTTLSVRATSCV
jgi:hypothetical protein